MSIDSIIAQAVAKAVKQLYGFDAAPGSIIPKRRHARNSKAT